MTRSRDSQRKKFWLAFYAVETQYEPLLAPKISEFVDTIVSSRWWRAKRPDIREVDIKIRDVRQIHTIRPSPDGYGWELRLPYQCTQLRVLVSLAHCLHDDSTAWHGPEYCRILLEAIERFVDQDTADALRAEFKVHRVKLRSWSLEARDAAKVRHAKKELRALMEGFKS